MAQLYQTFKCETSCDLKKSEKGNLIKLINSLSSSEHELIFTLIYEHYMRERDEKSEITSTPYGCSYVNGNATFNLTKIPIQLRHIIYKFVVMTSETERQRGAVLV